MNKPEIEEEMIRYIVSLEQERLSIDMTIDPNQKKKPVVDAIIKKLKSMVDTDDNN